MRAPVMPSAERRIKAPKPPAKAAKLAPPWERKRLPPGMPFAPVWRMTVEEYHQLIEQGFFRSGDPVELLDGFLVAKMARTPRHDSTIRRTQKRLVPLLGETWQMLCQMAITIDESEPEPDLAVVKGSEADFEERHPGLEEVALVVESALSSLQTDRGPKGAIYARAKIPVYWVINLKEREIEVFTQPGEKKGEPAYLKRQTYRPGARIPVVLFGKKVGELAVADLLP